MESLSYVEIDIPDFGGSAKFEVSNSGAGMALSNGGLTAQGTAGHVDEGARSNFSFSSGKFYCEMTLTASLGSDRIAFGIGQADAVISGAALLSTSYLGGLTTDGIGYWNISGVIYNDSTIGTLPTYTTGDVVCIAVDRDNDKVWFRKNGGNWNNTSDDPATNTGGFNIATIGDPLYVWINTEDNGYVGTANFGASAFAQAVPTGFSSLFPITYRFAIDASFLPKDIDCIPNINSIDFNPATLSLGVDLGQRATVTVKFRDHRHIWNGEAFTAGSIWGKFRARYGLKLRGNPLRVIRGLVGQNLVDMETRHFIIDSTDGPSTDGEYKIIAKDILKLADGDRAQAPVLSNGFLSANITNIATSATLAPSGIGNAEYPASGYVAIGGSEIVSFTRVADALTITRAQFNTVAAAHTAQDRVQLCLEYNAQAPNAIIADLFINYAGVPSSYINTANWATEISTYFATVYSALIAEPTSVNKLISELIEQVGLAIWWDAINQEIKLQVIRAIPTTADVFDQSITVEGTLDITEQPDQRLTDIYYYFGKINPLVNEDQIDNYRSTALVTDADAIVEYGGQAIKKLFSRWLATGGRTIAEAAATNILNRYRDPPRHFKFNLMRYSVDMPIMGTGYQLEGWPLQDTAGAAAQVPIQLTRVNPQADFFIVEADEMLSTITISPDSPGAIPHTLVIDSNLLNVNLRTMHDSIYDTPVSGNVITCTVNSGIIVGSSSTASPAFDVGSWPGGVIIQIIINGTIEGMGGQGGIGGLANGQQTAGLPGGTAFYTRQAINLTYGAGSRVWGGGGGGGGGGGSLFAGTQFSGGGGGGGAGRNGGAGGDYTHIGGPSGPGSAGTDSAGGAGGINAINPNGTGGTGGGPGLAGSAGNNGNLYLGASGGAAGTAIDGTSFVTHGNSPDIGDVRGAQIN